MNKSCPHCGLVFEREPGFFIGAMYVSYAFIVAIFITVALVLNYGFGDPDLWVYIFSVLGVVLIFLPLIVRYSRVLYLNGFGGIKYDKNL
ncbi:DUF983 domain-containing protein [Xanthovirga aplysinae]|uniref:DUF983 domain-containing protein n=1 Tax=Xanthovirga aplysinae TaxID=2529853 RepID=UPI001FE8EDC9|nr:DUF983 domain-containing protein [Xanthovirga aplysinae]